MIHVYQPLSRRTLFSAMEIHARPDSLLLCSRQVGNGNNPDVRQQRNRWWPCGTDAQGSKDPGLATWDCFWFCYTSSFWHALAPSPSRACTVHTPLCEQHSNLSLTSVWKAGFVSSPLTSVKLSFYPNIKFPKHPGRMNGKHNSIRICFRCIESKANSVLNLPSYACAWFESEDD